MKKRVVIIYTAYDDNCSRARLNGYKPYACHSYFFLKSTPQI